MVRSYRYVISLDCWLISCEASREDPDELRKAFPPLTTGRVPMGDVFTSCNWVLRDGLGKAIRLR
jgi:ATP-dependent DNA helicase 2 subunit 1